METTSSLYDIAPRWKYITIDGTKQKIRGIPFDTLMDIIGRFPDVAVVLTGGSLNPVEIMKFGGKAVASFIAAGFNVYGDKEAEAYIASYEMMQSLQLIKEVLEATMPHGPGPFVEMINEIKRMLDIKQVDGGSESSSSDPTLVLDLAAQMPPPRRKPSPTASPEPSNSSSPEADILNLKSGT